MFSASAQLTASLQKPKTINNICLERGHNITYKKSTTFRPPYTIDTKDSTVTVYPVPNASTGKCSRCGAEVDNPDKEIRITTWRASVITNHPFKSSSLDDIKKVATLRNDTLFIHKRIAPFTSIKEQGSAMTTIYYKNKPITFKAAIFDEAAFFSGKNGTDIF